MSERISKIEQKYGFLAYGSLLMSRFHYNFFGVKSILRVQMVGKLQLTLMAFLFLLKNSSLPRISTEIRRYRKYKALSQSLLIIFREQNERKM